MIRLILFSAFFLMLQTVKGQETTRLVTITEGSTSNPAGVGQGFFGQIMSDGLLYFRGSSNGLRRSIWRTDGTIAGTERVIQEESTFGSDWGQIFLYEDGFLINDDNIWMRLATGSNTLEEISNLPQESISNFNQATNGKYYFTTERNGQIILFKADSNVDNVIEIGEVHPESFTVLVQGGNYGAVIFNDNSFQDNFPKVYLEATDELIDMESYLANLGIQIGNFTRATMYDDFLFVSYTDADNFFKDMVVDMSTNQIAEFDFIREPRDIFSYQDDLLMIANNTLIRFNTNDLSFQEIYGNTTPLTPSFIYQDKLYVVNQEDATGDNKIVEIDLADNSNRFLEDSDIGDFFYNSKFREYLGEFYFIAQDGFNFLKKYDFDTNTATIIDTLSTNTGVTVEHALEDVQGNLVISRRPGPIQHELYVLGDGGMVSSSVDYAILSDINVYPTIAIKELFFPEDQSDMLAEGYELIIVNAVGQQITNFEWSDNKLDVSSLPPGTYYGIVRSADDGFRFNFIKAN